MHIPRRFASFIGFAIRNISMLLNAFRRLFYNSQNRKARRVSGSARPELLSLEQRINPVPITVDTTLDIVNSGDTFISLREAINLANATAGDDIINFSVTGTITLDSLSNTVNASLPTILDATALINGAPRGTLAITGPGSSSLTISGLDDSSGTINSTRNFNIFNIASGGNLSISGVTVSGAKFNSNGGAFNNAGVLTVTNSTISGNSATNGGGGIYSSGTVAVTNSTISGNTAGEGGGIVNRGTLTVSNSTLSGNSATFGDGGGIINRIGTITVTNSTLSGNSARQGGGIANRGTLTVSNSTLSGNSTTSGFGGGIYNRGTLTVTNSTISGNTAGDGGGIANSGTLTVSNSTISGNSATQGGGIFNIGILNIANTIIANSISGGDFAVTAPNTNTNNLVEDGKVSGTTYAWTVTGDPLLGPLQNNGGPTATMALLTPSPAISTTLLVTPNLDQRSFTRINNDIGAYAYYAAPTVASISPTSGSTAGGTVITITGTNFVAGPNVVSINGVAATNVNFVRATSITATSPAGTAGANKSVLVTSAGGTNAANTLFTYAAAPSPTPTPTPPNPTPTPTPTAPLVVGTPPPSSGGFSTVTLYDPATGQPTGTAVPFPGFTGPIHVTSGDFNGDGVSEIFAGAGFGGGPAIAILNSQTGEVIEAFFAFDPSFTGGVFVAVQDVNGDGILDIIASAGPGGGPEVRIFNGANLNVLRSFFAYAEDFTGGVSVASIDFNGDGILDLVTGAGLGGAPHVKVFDGATNAILSQWYAYATDFTGGVFVAAGDIGNDGNIEVVTGAGPGGAPVVAVWDPNTGALLAQFMAYAEDFTGGVRVGVNDGNGDGIADILTGPGGGPEVKVFSFPALDLLFSFYSGDATNKGGVFVS
jgi:trimeric autotransporter adhesin